MNRKLLAAIHDVEITTIILVKAELVFLSLAPVSFVG